MQLYRHSYCNTKKKEGQGQDFILDCGICFSRKGLTSGFVCAKFNTIRYKTALTKTVGRGNFQRAGGWCEPAVPNPKTHPFRAEGPNGFAK